MVNTFLEVVGVVCVGAFVYVVWPPLLLLLVGVVLVVAANRTPGET